MIVRQYPARRRGSISVTTLFAAPGMLVLVGLVVYIGTLRDARTEAQIGADAAALAAARTLACDDLITRDPVRSAALIARVRGTAVALASANFAHGERLQLNDNPGHDTDGDLVLGMLDRPLGGAFVPAGPEFGGRLVHKVNAVRVSLRRSAVDAPLGGSAPDREVVARATAMLDWSVIGFLPRNDTPIPLMPIGLYTDHAGQHRNGWDARCEPGDQDNWRFDPELHRWIREPDGIPEVVVKLGRNTGDREVAARFLHVGVHSLPETALQLRRGMNRDQIRAQFGTGGFVLSKDNALPVPCSRECPSPDGADGQAALSALRAVSATGEGRIWPLFSGQDDESGSVQVSGWTAARIVACDRVPGGMQLILQPTVVCHPAAVTEQRPSPPPYCARNRTVCRVRLAE